MIRTPFSMPAHCIFDSNLGGFGNALRTPCGELSYIRIRSFVRGACFTSRAMEHMIPGEIREFVCVTIDQDSRNRDGTVVALRFMCQAQPALQNQNVACTPEPNNEIAYSMYGLSLVPLIIMDRHTPKPKKKELTYKGFPVMFFSSVDVQTETGDTKTMRKHKLHNHIKTPIKIMKSLNTMQLTEWVMQVESPTKLHSTSFMYTLIDEREYDSEHSKICSKLAYHVQRQTDHPPRSDSLERDAVVSCKDATHIAKMYTECTTPGFILDLIASKTFDECHLPFFCDPCGFPLYVSTCVILAATPSLLHSYVKLNDCSDEDRAIACVFDQFKSMTTGITTVLETLVQIEMERLASASAKHKPVSAEHLRRQGVTICHELCARLHTDSASHVSNIESEFCGAERFSDAMSVLDPACVQRSKGETIANGICGSTRQCQTHGTRCTTRTKRLRCLLQIMLEVNEMIETGIYNMRQEYERNTGDSTLRHPNMSPQNVLINIDAWNASSEAVSAYLVQGPFALLRGAGFTIFPIRHATRAACGDCKAKFDFCTTAINSRISHCPVCCAFYCAACYSAKVSKIRKATETDYVQSHHAVQCKDTLLCTFCSN